MCGAKPPAIRLSVVTPCVAGSPAETTTRSPAIGSRSVTAHAPEADAVTTWLSLPAPRSWATSTRAPGVALPESTAPARAAESR